jgi:flagellar export protein FliJ
MAFRFPLQAVFHFRQSVEHQQELLLRAANQRVVRVRRLIEQLDDRVRELRKRQSHALTLGTTGAEMRLALLGEVHFHHQRQQLTTELLRLEQLRDQQQHAFERARRERETFEGLRDAQLREYRREAARREQLQLDDLFAMRQAYLHRG